MRKHKPTVAEVIRARTILAGMDIPTLCRRTGIPKSTFYAKLDSGGWKLDEIAAIDHLVHFADDDIKILFKREG